MRSLVTGLLVWLAAAPLVCPAQTPPDAPASDAPKALLVTGASTLNAIKNVQAVRLDLTEQKDAAVETITKGGRGLYGRPG